MDSQEQILIRSSSHHIRSSPELPAEEGRGLEEVCTEDLEGDDEEDEVFREGFGAAEFGYLRRGLALLWLGGGEGIWGAIDKERVYVPPDVP